MQTKFKRHQSVKLTKDADPEYVEYHSEGENDDKETPIKAGMQGRINIILPNGKYHVEIISSEGKVIAYAPFNEEDLEAEDE